MEGDEKERERECLLRPRAEVAVRGAAESHVGSGCEGNSRWKGDA